MDSTSPQNHRSRAIIVVLLVALLLFAVALYSFVLQKEEEEAPQNVTSTFTEGERVTVKGTVVNKDTSKIPVDGPGILFVETADGKTIEVIFSCGMLMVPEGSVNVGHEAKIGDKVEAYGRANAGNSMIVCDSSDSYLKFQAN